MSLLVTGGAGFIGSYCLNQWQHCANGPLICLDNLSSHQDSNHQRPKLDQLWANPRIVVENADFCDTAAVDRLFAHWRPRRIVHLGGCPGVAASVHDPLPYVRNNIEGTLVLLEAARRYGVERFVLVSSSTVYGRGAPTPFCEDAPLGIPASPYGSSKRAAELLGLTYWQLHGLPVVCVRPFSVYGPGMRPDLALYRFAQSILQGRPLTIYGDGTVLRDLTHVADIADGLWRALTRDGVGGECINLGCGQPIQVRVMIQALEQALQRSARCVYLPTRDEDLPVTHADLSKAARLLHYRSSTRFADGVRDFAEWMVACSGNASPSGGQLRRAG